VEEISEGLAVARGLAMPSQLRSRRQPSNCRYDFGLPREDKRTAVSERITSPKENR
jgi:hypothetical protein